MSCRQSPLLVSDPAWLLRSGAKGGWGAGFDAVSEPGAAVWVEEGETSVKVLVSFGRLVRIEEEDDFRARYGMPSGVVRVISRGPAGVPRPRW